MSAAPKPPSSPRRAPFSRLMIFRRANKHIETAAEASVQNVGQDVIDDSQPKDNTRHISEGSTGVTETSQVSIAGTLTVRPPRTVSCSDVHNHTPHDARNVRKDVIKDSPAKDRTRCSSGDPTIATEACRAATQDLDGHAAPDIGLDAFTNSPALTTTRPGGSTAASGNSQVLTSVSCAGSPASWLRTTKATLSRAMTSPTTGAVAAQMPSPPAAVEAHPVEVPIVMDPPIFSESAFVLHRRRFGHRGSPPLSEVMLAGWDQQVKRAMRKEVAAMEWWTPQNLPEDVFNRLAASELRRAKALLQETAVFDDL